MAKYKAAKSTKGGQQGPPKPGAIPCAILIIGAIALVSFLFYQVLSSSVK